MSLKKKIGIYTEEHLLSVAKGVVEKKTADSKILDAAAEGRIPKFNTKGTCGIHTDWDESNASRFNLHRKKAFEL